jgi:menaquinone-dependent protoporphyrinogen IX oxidase
MSDEVYDYDKDIYLSEYDKAILVADVTMDRSEEAFTQAVRMFHTAMCARSEAARLFALMDAGEAHNSEKFLDSVKHCQEVSREIASTT